MKNVPKSCDHDVDKLCVMAHLNRDMNYTYDDIIKMSKRWGWNNSIIIRDWLITIGSFKNYALFHIGCKCVNLRLVIRKKSTNLVSSRCHCVIPDDVSILYKMTGL